MSSICALRIQAGQNACVLRVRRPAVETPTDTQGTSTTLCSAILFFVFSFSSFSPERDFTCAECSESAVCGTPLDYCTFSVGSSVRLTLPEVPVIVSVEVPFGVPGLWTPPPLLQPHAVSKEIEIMAKP